MQKSMFFFLNKNWLKHNIYCKKNVHISLIIIICYMKAHKSFVKHLKMSLELTLTNQVFVIP